jgi:AcrR family transcriptional regulator
MRLDMSVPARARPTPLERALGAARSTPRATPLEALAAARRLWAAGERLDMGTLAQALRVSRATLYSWVGNRERLIGEVLWSFAEQGIAQARAAARSTGAAHVVDVFQYFIRLNADFAPLRRFIAEDPALALRILTSKDGPIQQRMIAACRALLEEQAAAAGFAPALDLDTLAYVIIRVAESFLYSDLITGNQPDVGKAVEVVRVLLGMPASRRRPGASSRRR